MRQTLGVAAILLYSAHAVVLIHRGEAHDLLWGCHVAVLFVGAGLLASSARLNSIGLLWSCFGMPLWVLYAFTGGEVLATSGLTHVGAFVIGTYGVRLLGIGDQAIEGDVRVHLALVLPIPIRRVDLEDLYQQRGHVLDEQVET